ncbi:MAG TPA: serine protease [Solirubrobacterales bacterium]|nr:serine protease [Solirubrobacterales bacterium]
MHRCTFVCAVMALALFGIAPAAASAWAPAGTAPIHPGVQTHTEGAQCTANFIFSEGSTVFIGQAAHCSGTGGSTETNGCTSASLPLGTAVEVTGATEPGKLAYNSWLAMQAGGESDEDTCAFNDLALVQLNPADVGSVNPSVPGFGGPEGVGGPGEPGATIYSYGNSELRGGITKLSPKQGFLLATEGEGWTHLVTTLTPGIPGDSGSGFLDASGNAFGVLSTLDLAPLPGSNGVGDLAKELAYERAHGPFPNLQLVKGTVKFKANLVEAILGS